MFKYNAETNKAIRDGFNKLKLGKQYENLYAAVLAGLGSRLVCRFQHNACVIK